MTNRLDYYYQDDAVVGPVVPASVPGVRRAAVLAVCGLAANAANAAELPAALGLDPREGRP